MDNKTDKRSRWFLLPFALLVPLMILQLTMLTISTQDPGFAVEENYYQKAVDWDQEMAQRALNQQLSWRLDLSLQATDSGNERTKHQLNALLTDREDQPLTDARVTLTAFPNARAGQKQELVLSEQQPGMYSSELHVTRSGLWELRATVLHDGRRFTKTQSLEIGAHQLRGTGADAVR